MNWEQRMNEVISRKKFSEEDIELAGNFMTCPIGEKFNLKEVEYYYTHLKQKYGNEITNKIMDLGVDFENRVINRNIKQAQQIFNKIQKLKI